MFWHNFKYSFLTIIKNKTMIFWMFMFPIILAVFFNMAFGKVNEKSTFSTLNIAVVGEAGEFGSALKELSDKSSDDYMLNIKYTDKEDADNLLLQNEITGYLEILGKDIKINVRESGIEQTILKSVVDRIIHMGTAKKQGIDIVNSKSDNKESAYVDDISPGHLDYMMIETYSLISMACLYGGMLGMTAMNRSMPNMTELGKRVASSPVPKMRMILSALLAGYVIQLFGAFLLLGFTRFVLKVDFGDNTGLVVLLVLAGCLAGVAMGITAGVLFKLNEGNKMALVMAISLLGSFFSGMMGITMKYTIDTYAPIINKMNPAAMITDGLYSLYYYDTYDRYTVDIVSLVIFASVLSTISLFVLRRQTYDSI